MNPSVNDGRVHGTTAIVTGGARRMRSLRRPFQIIRNDLRAFLVLNAIAFGMFLVGCVLGLIFPELVQAQAIQFEQSGQADLALRVFQNP